jgi:hypothetical protein
MPRSIAVPPEVTKRSRQNEPPPVRDAPPLGWRRVKGPTVDDVFDVNVVFDCADPDRAAGRLRDLDLIGAFSRG